MNSVHNAAGTNERTRISTRIRVELVRDQIDGRFLNAAIPETIERIRDGVRNTHGSEKGGLSIRVLKPTYKKGAAKISAAPALTLG